MGCPLAASFGGRLNMIQIIDRNQPTVYASKGDQRHPYPPRESGSLKITPTLPGRMPVTERNLWC